MSWKIGLTGMLVGIAAGGCEGPPGVVFGLDERPVNRMCVAPPPPPRTVALERVFAAVPAEFPIELRQAAGGDWYLAERAGLIYRFPDRDELEPGEVEVVLDLRAVVESETGETGLLGLALHPGFEGNGELFVSYTTGSGESLVSRISRFTSTDGGATFDVAGEAIVLEVPQPRAIHNAGHILFGPDGYLYVGLGDGGLPGGDPEGRAQNLENLYGAVLRLDVDGAAPYAIPADNPFVDVPGARPEIFAYGFRNPWRFQFDDEGTLWLGDVGHGQWEEVDHVIAGGNYGWPHREGAHCFRDPCDQDELIDPFFEYRHDDAGDRSITAGFVYRGLELFGYQDRYLFGDWTSGRIWTLEASGNEYRRTELAATGTNIVSFAQDLAGELYVVGARPGAIYRLVPGGGTPLPASLSLTGCVDPDAPAQPATGLIPYTVAVPFWSDGAGKDRYLALPEGETIAIRGDGDWVLPPGAVTMKHFRHGDRLIETRFFVRHADGSYSGYGYGWNEDQRDASLVTGTTRIDLGDAEWILPSPGSCLACHTEAAGRSLGLETAQLDIAMRYPTESIANQVTTLAAIGVIAEPGARGALAASDDESMPLAERARAYLHVNCSHCHRPDGPARGDLDLRVSTSLAATHLCEPPVLDDLGIADARVVVPGDRERSILYQRMLRRDQHGMPPLASVRPDQAGAGLIGAWIDALAGCP